MDSMPRAFRSRTAIVLGVAYFATLPGVALFSPPAAVYALAGGAAAALGWVLWHGFGPIPQEIIKEPARLSLPGVEPPTALRPGPEPAPVGALARRVTASVTRSGPLARVSAGLTVASGLSFVVSIGAALSENHLLETVTAWTAAGLLGSAVVIGAAALWSFFLESRRLARLDD